MKKLNRKNEHETKRVLNEEISVHYPPVFVFFLFNNYSLKLTDYKDLHLSLIPHKPKILPRTCPNDSILKKKKKTYPLPPNTSRSAARSSNLS